MYFRISRMPTLLLTSFSLSLILSLKAFSQVNSDSHAIQHAEWDTSGAVEAPIDFNAYTKRMERVFSETSMGFGSNSYGIVSFPLEGSSSNNITLAINAPISLPVFGRRPQLLSDITEDLECISKKQANRYISQFKILKQSFGDIDLCDNANLFKSLLNSFSVLESARFSNVPVPGMSQVLPYDYYTYMKGQKLIIEHDTWGRCPAMALACIEVPSMTCCGPGKDPTARHIYVTDFYVSKQVPFVTKFGTLVHESRHAGWKYFHKYCTHGFYKGQPACDSDFASQGSYVVEIEFYLRVALAGQNFDASTRAMALIYGIFGIENHINQPELSPQEGVLLVDAQDDHVVLFDGEHIIERPQLVVRGARLLNRSMGFDVIPINSNGYAWYLNPHLRLPYVGPIDDLVLDPSPSYIGSPSSREIGKDVVDLYSSQGAQFFLYEDKLVVKGPPGTTTVWEILVVEQMMGRDARFVTNAFCDETKEYKDDVYPPIIKTSDDNLYRITFTKHLMAGGSLNAMNSMSLQRLNCQWPRGASKIVQSGKRRFVLTEQGELNVVDGNQTSIPLPGRRFSDMKKTHFYIDLMEK